MLSILPNIPKSFYTSTRLIAAFASFLLATGTINAATIYVDASASSGGDGSSGSPYQTIQQAADDATAGDTVRIHAGTYRESVVVPNDGSSGNPIVFEAYGDGEVIVSGAELVTGWELYADNIYRTTAPVTGMSDRFENQIFVNGVMLNEARWPNSPLDPLRFEYSRLETAQTIGAQYHGQESEVILGTTYNINTYRFEMTDPAFAELNGKDLTGAYASINAGLQNLWRTGEIYDKNESQNKFRVVLQDWGDDDHEQEANDPYYIFGALDLLDYPGEWCIGTDGKLYIMTPDGDSPENHTVEMKQRTWAFDLTQRDYVTIRNISVFSAGITTEREATSRTYTGELGEIRSTNILIDNIHAKYVFHNIHPFGVGFTSTYWKHANNSGIVLNGANQEIRNSVIEYSSANGITLLGTSPKAINNIVTNCNYVGMDNAPISTGYQNSRSEGTEILNNTILNSGRALILARNIKAGKINYNYVSNSCMTTSDYGAIYTWGHNGNGTEIAYNWVTDNTSEHFGSIGIYIDDGATNFEVHHNVSWNTKTAFVMNMVNNPGGVTCDYHEVYNNTFEAFTFALGNYTSTNVLPTNQGWNNTNIYNNVFIGNAGYRAASKWNNYENASTSDLQDFNGLDFRPVGGTQADGKGAYTTTGTWKPGAGEGGQPAPNTQPIVNAPTNLTYTVVSGDQLQLNWHDNSGNETGFVIDRSDNGEGFYTIATTPADTTSFTISGRAATNSYYRVRANESQYTNYIYVNPNVYMGTYQLGGGRSRILLGDKISGALTIPSPESGSPIDNIQHNDVMRLNDWYLTTEMNNIKTSIIGWGGGFPSPGGQIEVRLDNQSGTLLTTINVPDGNNMPGDGVINTSVSISTAQEGLHDLYLIFKNPSATGTKLFLMGDFIFTSPTELAAPGKSLVSVTSADSSSATLAWTPSASADSYIIERSDDLHQFYQIAQVNAGTTTYTDSSAAVAPNRFYRIRARNLHGDAPYDYAAANVQGNVLAKPTDLAAVSNTATTIDLTWTDNSVDEDEFIVERSLDGSTGWTEIARPTANATTYTATGLTTHTRYYFRVKASNASTTSAPSNIANAYAGGAPVISLYAYEGFDGSIDSGTGWASGWNLGGAYLELGASQLAYGTLPTNGVSGQSVWANATRALATPQDFTGSEVWFTWLHRLNNATQGSTSVQINPGISGSPQADLNLSYNGLWFDKDGSGGWVNYGSGSANTTYLMVLRLKETGGTTTATVWTLSGGSVPTTIDEGSKAYENTLSTRDATIRSIGLNAHSLSASTDFQMDEIRIGDSYESVTGQASSSTGFASWISTQLSGTGMEASAAATDDPDGDGINNFTEYAFGGNPAAAEAISGMPSATHNSGNLDVTFTLGQNASDVTYTVEFSEDLTDWSSLTPAIVPTTYSAGQSFSTSMSMSGKSKLFARVKAVE